MRGSSHTAAVPKDLWGNCDGYRTSPLTEAIAHSSPTQALDPASFIVRARYELLRQLIERVLQGESFLALSGAPGTGKSAMVRAIHNELLNRSVTVFHIERGENDGIGSRSIICQLLHKPEAAFQPDDVETLFDTLATGGDHGQRRTIIIDDAELLRPDALQYVRLVSNMLPEQMPPVVFVGRSSFWDVPGQPGGSDAHDLITCRMELERLSDEEAHAFIRENLPEAACARLDDATREALVRQADGSIGQLAALLTATRDIPGGRGMPSAGQAVTDAADGQEPTLTIDESAPAAANGTALAVLPTADIVLNPVAASPPIEHARNAARWPTVMRQLTAAALMLTVVGTVAYWQLTVHAGQTQRAANSAEFAAPLDVGNAARSSQEAPLSSNAVIDGNVATEPPAQASPTAAGPSPGPSGPPTTSIQPALTAPVFRTISTDDPDQPPASMAAELSVALSDDAVWLVLDSIGAEQLLSLGSAPAEQPPQPPTIGQPATGTEPAAPQVQTAAVPNKPSEVIPVPAATPTPPSTVDNGLAAALTSPDPVADIPPSPGGPQAPTAAVPDKPSEVIPVPAATPTPPSTVDNGLAAAPASPDRVADIPPSPGGPQAPTAAVPDKPSEVIPVSAATPTPPSTVDNGLAAAPASPDPVADIQPSPEAPQAPTAAVPDKPSEVIPVPAATPTPPSTVDNGLAAAPASPDSVADIQPSPGAPQAPTAAVPDKSSEVIPVPATPPTPPSTVDNGLAAAPASPDPGRTSRQAPAMPRKQAAPSATLRQLRWGHPSRQMPARQGPSRCRCRQPMPLRPHPRFRPSHSLSPTSPRR